MADSNSADYIVIGKVGAPHGVKGYLKVHSFTDPADNILQYQPWLLKVRDEWQQVDVDDVKMQGGMILAQLGGIADRDEARRYTHCEIAVPREVLPDTAGDEYYWSDIIGCTVTDVDGNTIGVVTHMIETGANDVMVVAGTREFAIPFILDDVVVAVDIATQSIQVRWDTSQC